MQSSDKGLPVFIKTGWAIGELSVASYVGITMMYFLFFLTEALEISPAWAGTALLIPRLWDVITDPIMGIISDRTKSRWGRRRPYLLVGGILFGISFCLVFFVPDFNSELITVVYFTFMYLIVSTAYTIYDVPYSSMLAEMTSDYKERTLLTGYKMIAARLGIIISVLVGPYLFNAGETLREGFELLGLVFGFFITITCLIGFFATAKAPHLDIPVESISIKDELKAVIRNRPFSILFTVFLFQNLAIGASATALIYYLTIVMQTDTTLAGNLFATLAITSLVFTPLWVYVTRRFGKTGTYFASLSAAAVVSLPALFLPMQLYWILFVILFCGGIFDAANQLLPNSMVPDTVEVDELDSGVRREGAIFGAWAFCRKLGMALGAFLVSIGLQMSGYVPGEDYALNQSDGTVLGIRLVYAGLPFLLWIFAALTLRKYNLDEERFNNIKENISKSGKAAKPVRVLEEATVEKNKHDPLSELGR